MIAFLKKNNYLLAGMFTGLITVFTVSQLIVNTKLSNAKAEVEARIKLVEEDLNNLSQAIAVGGKNEVALSLMPDCKAEDRSLFDNNLSRLDKGLTSKELDDLDRVFNYCAPVYAIHRSVMTMQLSQKTIDLENLITQRNFLSKFEDKDHALATWKELAAVESSVSKLSYDLVTLQKEIITDLINGLDVNSESAAKLKGRGQAIQVEMRAATKKATELRESLNAKVN